ncbi:MAG TPA: hypothetical protein VNT57_01915 [Desulfobacteria bacterium]|nr:hypothetical protein [Desulfobacteria bacterium]
MLMELTKKLADTMNIKLPDITPLKREPFYEWHANLFLFDRRKGVILMNNRTRYCIVLFGLKAEHFRKFSSIVLTAIEETFLAEGFPEELVRRYMEKCGNVVYTKTHDRSILSQINDMHVHLSWKIEEYLPNSGLNVMELNRWLGRILLGSQGYSRPIEKLTEEMNLL